MGVGPVQPRAILPLKKKQPKPKPPAQKHDGNIGIAAAANQPRRRSRVHSPSIFHSPRSKDCKSRSRVFPDRGPVVDPDGIHGSGRSRFHYRGIRHFFIVGFRSGSGSDSETPSMTTWKRRREMARDEQPLGEREAGGSIAVPNVQQLASVSKDDHVLPIRYIRPELELDQLSIDGSHQVPVIDMIKLAADDEESAKLHSACKDWGFFQVINHGVTEEVIQRMKLDLQVFFNQPLEEKMSCAQLPNGLEGYGQAFVVSEEQKLDWGDMLFILSLPVNGRNMRFWPKVPSSFRASFEQYSSDLEKLALNLLSYMAKNLGLEPEKLLTRFEEGFQSIRMNYYPPCKESNKVMGLTPHSDATGLTLLTQVNDVQGLQIKRDGKWVPIVPIPGAFIVNVGDIIEMMSNGEYRSIEHRAVVNPEKERMSIAAFHSPNMKAMLGPIPDLINEKKQAKYQSVLPEEFMKLVVSSKLDGKGLLSQLMINE
ncbi:S-norcoclaurine synthase 1 [Linum perenne]